MVDLPTTSVHPEICLAKLDLRLSLGLHANFEIRVIVAILLTQQRSANPCLLGCSRLMSFEANDFFFQLIDEFFERLSG